MQELASLAIKSLTPYLQKISDTAILSGREVAAKVLYDLISFAFKAIGGQAEWEAYADNPVEPATVEALLATALINQPDLVGDMERVVRVVMHDDVDLPASGSVAHS